MWKERPRALTDVPQRKPKEKPSEARGKLRIGDDWNAITIIALSQSSPLKAIAELVENSIDAKARNVVITRGRDSGRHFLAIRDDGEGVPPDCDGRPDFPYVATHICDSVKHRLKAEGKSGLQGEFGIGLLSFWVQQGDILHHARAVPKQSDAVRIRGFVQIELDVNIALRSAS